MALVPLLGILLTSISCYAFLPATAAPQAPQKAITVCSDSAQFLQEFGTAFLSNICSPLRADPFTFYILNFRFNITPVWRSWFSLRRFCTLFGYILPTAKHENRLPPEGLWPLGLTPKSQAWKKNHTITQILQIKVQTMEVICMHYENYPHHENCLNHDFLD